MVDSELTTQIGYKSNVFRRRANNAVAGFGGNGSRNRCKENENACVNWTWMPKSLYVNQWKKKTGPKKVFHAKKERTNLPAIYMAATKIKRNAKKLNTQNMKTIVRSSSSHHTKPYTHNNNQIRNREKSTSQKAKFERSDERAQRVNRWNSHLFHFVFVISYSVFFSSALIMIQTPPVYNNNFFLYLATERVNNREP